MARKVFATTIKNNVRSIVFLLSVVAVLMFFINDASGWREQSTHWSASEFHKAMANFALMPLRYAVPVFIGITASVDIMRDKKNKAFDIIKTTSLKTHQYFFAKVFAYLLMGFICELALSYGHFIIYYFIVDRMEGYDYSVLESVWMIFLRAAVFALNSVPIYVSVAVAASLITSSSIAGITSCVALVAYGIIGMPYFTRTFLGDYVFPVADHIENYMYFYKTHLFPEDILYIPVSNVLVSFAIEAAICIVLFSLGYILIHDHCFSMRFWKQSTLKTKKQQSER